MFEGRCEDDIVSFGEQITQGIFCRKLKKQKKLLLLAIFQWTTTEQRRMSYNLDDDGLEFLN